VAARDQKALLCRIAGALAHLGLSILSAKIFTLGGGRVVDRFWVAHPEEEDATAEALGGKLLGLLRADFRMGREELRALPGRRRRSAADVEREVSIVPKVLVSNEISDAFTVADVTCGDQIGLLFQVALVFSELGLDVHGAVLTTEADKAMDAFYITVEGGGKVEDIGRIEAIRAAIESELASR
jgi:[protein-PII] uridylyltransferase